MYWSKQLEGSRIVHSDGIPFTIHKCSTLDCQYGDHYWKNENIEGSNKSSHRLRLQSSRKIGCHAHITIHEYALYPDFKFHTSNQSLYKLRQKKKHILEAARLAIKNETAKIRLQYFVLLPTLAAHSGHPISAAASFCQCVPPAVVKKNSELVSTGMSETKEVQKAHLLC